MGIGLMKSVTKCHISDTRSLVFERFMTAILLSICIPKYDNVFITWFFHRIHAVV